MKPLLLKSKSLIVASTIILTSCSHIDNPANKVIETQYTPRAENAALSHKQALYRASRIADVSYQLDFTLTGDTTFSAISTLNFNLTGVTHPITIDLNKAKINQLSVNGHIVTPQYNQWFITVSPEHLHHGNNTITVDYQREHNTNGQGSHRFKDPVDGRVYLYSQFEAASAPQVFPVFDQPDLKATYQLLVTAPADWHVISANRETSATLIDGNKRWDFGKTAKLSSYNFSIHAGPYHIFKDDTGKYPARLFARQSVADQVVAQDWFTYTRQGLAFFEDYFGIDYPFKKYDQLLVPDFLYGAMENVAAVTFAEGAFLTAGEKSAKQKELLAMVIMHEMAHQWFGDLVTMKWWNGLWLNESFAAFMATLATAEATEFDNAWRTFYISGKQGAYTADQRVTTHPIETPVASTANAEDNLDAITYSKGASVLQQLRQLLGPEVFRQGVHDYLVQYSYKNATLDNFIDSLGKAAGRDMRQWVEHWLYQPGVNTITAQYRCDNQTISEFSLQQTANPEYPVYREQRVNIALFGRDAHGQLQLNQAAPVTYSGKTTPIKSLIGSACPDLVYPNYQDWGFVKVNLDSHSFDSTKSSLNQVNDPLLRSMLWQSLWDSVLEGLLPLNEYLDVTLQNIGAEQDHIILSQVLDNIVVANGYLGKFDPSTAQYHQTINKRLEDLTWQGVLANKNQPKQLRSWFDSSIELTQSPAALNRLHEILTGKQVVENLPLAQGLRWTIIQKLNQFDVAGSFALIADELTRDDSDNGHKQAIIAKSNRPDAAQKQYWLDQLHSDTPDMPFSKLRMAMYQLYPTSQYALMVQTADAIIASLASLDKKKSVVFMRNYNEYLLPKVCTKNGVAKLAKAITQNPDLTVATHRALRVAHQDAERCLTIRAQLTVND